MALISPSPIVSTISGALGGTTFRRGRGSIVACHRPRKVATRSARAVAARARFQWAVARWQALSVDTRAAWGRLAQGLQFTDRLGAARQLSGRALFLRCELLSLEANAGVDVGLLRSFQQPAMLAAGAESSASGSTYAYFLSNDDTTPRYVMFWGAAFSGAPSLSRVRSWRYIGRIPWANGTLISAGPPALRRFTLTGAVRDNLGTRQAGQQLALRARAALFSASKGLPGPILYTACTIEA